MSAWFVTSNLIHVASLHAVRDTSLRRDAEVVANKNPVRLTFASAQKVPLIRVSSA